MPQKVRERHFRFQRILNLYIKCSDGGPRARHAAEPARARGGARLVRFKYRRMMPKLLAALEFRSNNGARRPLLDALAAIRRAEGEGRQYFRTYEIAIEGVIRPKWRGIVSAR